MLSNGNRLKREQRTFRDSQTRRGSVIVIAALIIVVIMAFTAFTVDIGYITVTKAELQKSADGAALAAALELPAGVGIQATQTLDEVSSIAREAAVDVAAANRGGGLDEVYADGDRDVRFGQVQWDADSEEWVKNWETTPYNMVEVTLRRDQEADAEGNPNAGGDRPLSLFFAPVIGHDQAGVSGQSLAAILPGSGFRINTGSGATVGILPIALDEPTWNQLVTDQTNGSSIKFQDNYSYNEETGAITNGSDGKFEVNLYPEGKSTLPPGNRGTVDLGNPNNATSDLVRQILYGLNETDLSFFDGEIKASYSEPLILNGDTGISAGMKDELHSIRGLPRAIPKFTEVHGPGNNAQYTIVKFVGIRIMNVKLVGNPKHVYIEMAPFSEQTVTYDGTETIQDSYIFTAPALIR